MMIDSDKLKLLIELKYAVDEITYGMVRLQKLLDDLTEQLQKELSEGEDHVLAK